MASQVGPSPLTVKLWLQKAGYHHLCFISWARGTANKDEKRFVRKFQTALEAKLGDYRPGEQAAVFLDESGIALGERWDLKLGEALCRSVVMVAVCWPPYYDPEEHHYCAREWATAEELSSLRFRGHGVTSIIIPALLRGRREHLPDEVKQLEYVDFSQIDSASFRCHEMKEFRRKVTDVSTRIQQIAERAMQGWPRAECQGRNLTARRAFESYHREAREAVEFAFRRIRG